MKTIFGFSKKAFSVKRYIKPRHTQQYFDNKVINRFNDKMSFRYNRNTEQIFPSEVIFPDKNLPSPLDDETNQNFYEHLIKFQTQTKNRLKSHLKVSEKVLEDINFFETEKIIKGNSGMTSQYMDDDTGLLYGVGYDTFIHKINKDKQEILSQDNKIDLLVNKLGYVDLREFIALNRYILEAKTHSDSLVQAKAKYLEEAVNKLTRKKREEVRNKFSMIDTKQELDNSGKTDQKVEFLLDNYAEIKDLFYKNYYKIKEMSFRELEKSLSDFDKYEMLRENAKNGNVNLADKYNDDKVHLNENISGANKNVKNGFDQDAYVDEIIKKYRDNRIISMKINSSEIKQKIQSFIDQRDINDIEFDFELKSIFSIIKFYTFFNKYKKMYIPTNMETERIINRYLKERALKKVSFESIQLNDPIFSPLLQNSKINNDEKILDFEITDETSKEKYIQWEKLKKTYFEAKFENEKKKAIENVDKNIAADLGYVVLESIISKQKNGVKNLEDAYFNEVFPGSRIDDKMDLIETIVDKHYKSFKLEYMYNYMDFFSNKYRIRRKIAEEMRNRVELSEINELLNKICEKEVAPLKSPRPFSVKDVIANSNDKIVPDFFDILSKQNTNTKLEKEMKNAVEEIKRDMDKTPLELNNYDQFEIEAYKGVKNDPFFKHYLKTHLSFFLETYNEMTSNTPFYMRGFKKTDYIKWQQMSIPHIAKKKKSINSLQNKETNKQNEIYEKVMNDYGDISRFTNMTEAERLPRFGYWYGFGKRKKARASAYIKPGSGVVTINGKPAHKYLQHPSYRGKMYAPLVMTGNSATLDVKILVFGGGISGQMEAIVPAIAKALVQMNPDYIERFAKSFFLTHDPRHVEPKKPGRIKARRGYVYNRR